MVPPVTFMQQDQELTSTVKRGYTPEEQYTSTGNQGPWTDVYGLCATIYKCITGTTPADAIDRMAYDSLKRPSELGVRISPEFENAIMCGLALHAKDRCQSMDELLRLMQGSTPETTGNEAEDSDATMFADQTYFSQNNPTYTQPTYTHTQSTTGYGQPGMYDPDDTNNRQASPERKKKKFLIPAIVGGIAVAAAAGFIPSVSAVYTQSVIHDWPIMFIISYIFAFFVTKAAIKIARSSVGGAEIPPFTPERECMIPAVTAVTVDAGTKTTAAGKYLFPAGCYFVTGMRVSRGRLIPDPQTGSPRPVPHRYRSYSP